MAFLDVFLGHGDGAFTIGSVTPINSSSPVSVALADFNGDGNLDVVTSNSMPLPGGGGISVLFGKGDGTLQETTDAYPAVLGFPMGVAVGDFNGDHIPDIVVSGEARLGGTTTQGAVSVLLGNGNGTFQAPKVFASGGSFAAGASFAEGVAVGDFNRDGKLDIVTANFNFSGSGAVGVLLGNGNGTFQAPLSFPGLSQPSALAVGDFNRDGFPDVAVTDLSTNSVAVFINSGSWPALATTATASTSPSSQPASTAALTPLDSAPSPAGNRSSALFWLDPAVVDQLFASPSAEDRMGLWFGTRPLALDGWTLDGWGDQALSDAFWTANVRVPVRSKTRLPWAV